MLTHSAQPGGYSQLHQQTGFAPPVSQAMGSPISAPSWSQSAPPRDVTPACTTTELPFVATTDRVAPGFSPQARGTGPPVASAMTAQSMSTSVRPTGSAASYGIATPVGTAGRAGSAALVGPAGHVGAAAPHWVAAPAEHVGSARHTEFAVPQRRPTASSDCFRPGLELNYRQRRLKQNYVLDGVGLGSPVSSSIKRSAAS